MSEVVKVHIAGVGVNTTVTVESGGTVADALAAASLAESGLSVRRNGETLADTSVPAQQGDQLVVTPPAVKLG